MLLGMLVMYMNCSYAWLGSVLLSCMQQVNNGLILYMHMVSML
jgi:hypothetical protein